MNFVKKIVTILHLSFNLATEECCKREALPVGGQAVIEGVLMKGQNLWAMCVRNPKGEIVTETWQPSTWIQTKFWQIPIVRGFAIMIEMMRVGLKAISRSADISLGEEENLSTLETAGTIVFALFAVVGLFIALPMFAGELVAKWCNLSAFAEHALEGLFRGIIFVAYVAGISCFKDIARVFEYHGAEHKTINAYENGSEMIPDEVSKFSRIHRRCGTSFLIIVIVVSIVVFALIPTTTIFWRIASRVILLPLVIGISYEIIKGASKSNGIGKWLITPALALQFITTREPSNDQLDVAISALNEALDA